MSDEQHHFTLSLAGLASDPPEVILDRIARPATWPEWVPEISSTKGKPIVGPGDDVEGRAGMLGFVVDGRARITESTPTRFVQDVVIGVRIVARYEIEPAGSGSVIRHDLIVSAPRGPTGRVLAVFLRWRLRAMQRRLLRNLSSKRDGPSGSSARSDTQDL